jgi:hypothetical protein
MSGKNPLGQGKEPQSYEGLNVIVPLGGWQFVRAKRDPTTNDKKYPVGTIWLNTASQNIWMQTQPAGVWSEIEASGSSVLSIIGTANQIAASSATGNVTLSLIGPYTPATYTAHGVLMGEGTSSIAASSAGTSGQVFTSGGASADGAYQTIGVNSGLTAHGVLLAENNSAFVATAAGSNGQVFLGSTSADPAFGTLTTSTGVAFTTGAHALTIDVQNGGYAVVDQTSGSATLAKQTSYVTDNGASLVTYTLPLAANAVQGNVYQVTGGSVGGWTIAQNASQTIHLGAQNTTTGTGGSLSSNSRYASVTLQCINATGLDFVVIASVGTFTVV